MKKVQYITTMGLFFGLALVLSALEGLLPPVPFLPPGVKLGLSNIVTMYCLLYFGVGSAYAVVVLKSAFVFVTRGATAFFMSFCGGLAAVTVMALLLLPKRYPVSVFLMSVFGAVCHNLGQIAVAAVLLGGFAAFAYLPVLLIAGVLMGTVTGIVMKTVLPAISKLNLSKSGA